MPTADDLQFRDLTLQNKLATPGQIEECLAVLNNYKEAGIAKPISAILLDKGYLTPPQVKAIHQLQGKGEEHNIRGYTLLETLGRGGLGVVYKARQDSVGRIIALKVMYPHLTSNADYLKRFMREARISANLDHPNIVRGIDFGESNGVYFFAMEYVAGKSLKEMLVKEGMLSELAAGEIILQVAGALKHAEDHNLVHRDIKPDNIMLSEEGIPKLCDLGLAKIVDTDMSITHTGIVMGTPHYISPEQAMGVKDLDIRSDLYSLGTTFYHMVSGEVPYKGNTVVSIISQHIASPLPSPKEKNEKLSDEICAIITKMMAKERNDRYQTAQELIVDLNRFLRGQRPMAMDAQATTRIKPLKAGEKPAPLPEGSAKEMAAIIEAVTMDMGTGQLPRVQETPGNHPAPLAVSPSPSASSVPAAISQSAPAQPATAATPAPASAPAAMSQAAPAQPAQPAIATTPAPASFPKKKRWIGLVAGLFLLLGGAGVHFYGWEELSDDLHLYYESWFPTPVVVPSVEEEPSVPPQPLAVQQQQFFAQQTEKVRQHPAQIPLATLRERMVRIPGGPCTLGTAGGEGDWDERPARQATLASFWIDRAEVTNEEYERFCKATGHPTPPAWKQGQYPSEKASHPVVTVTWYDAVLYAQWMGKRLPTEDEWEYAARGNQSRLYAWGNKYDKSIANLESTATQPVSTGEKAKTPLGVYHLTGNVWEWTVSCYPTEKDQEERVIKGGGFRANAFQARAAFRDGFLPYGRRDDLGFRCAMDEPK